MTTLDVKAGSDSTIVQPTEPDAPTTAVEQSTGTDALISEQQVLLGSAAALAPVRRRSVVGDFGSAVRAMFVRPEKPRVRRHYPPRYSYLENAAMSRAMDRL
jgi:hypothetical protein